MVTKDEALKMAIEDAMKFVNTLNGYEDANQSKPFKTEADKYLSYASVVIKSLATSLQEALAQPAQEVGDAEIKQMLDDIEYYKNRLAKYEDVL